MLAKKAMKKIPFLKKMYFWYIRLVPVRAGSESAVFKQSTKRLLGYIKHVKGLLIISFIASIIFAATTPGFIQLFRYFMDSFESNHCVSRYSRHFLFYQ